MLLAFDTATESCAVALARGAEVIERSEHVGQAHSARLLPMAKALLAEAGVSPRQLDAIAFGAGPGSFTGLRIACGVAQGLAYGIDRPVVPVGNLEALAFNAACEAPTARRIAVAIDARMGECYWAVYQVAGEVSFQADAGGALADLVPPSLSSAGDLAAALGAVAPDALAGEAFSLFGAQLDAVPAMRRLPQVTATAAAIARLGLRALRAGRAVAPALAAPLYVRDRVAQTTAERHAQRAARAV